jgi:hypothetical protein
VKKLVIAVAAVALLVGLGLPTTSAHAAAPRALSQVVEGCNGEAVQMTPGAMPPFRISKRTIHFGYTEWHFPPTCRDQLRRDYVKVYKVKKGKDPKVYSTTGDRYSKKFKKGTYRVKVRYEYRYWNAQTKTYGAWHGLSVTKTVRLR